MKNRITWSYMSQSYSGIRPRWFRFRPVKYKRSVQRGKIMWWYIDHGYDPPFSRISADRLDRGLVYERKILDMLESKKAQMTDGIKECHDFIGVPADGTIFIYNVGDMPDGFFKIGSMIRIGLCVYKIHRVGITRFNGCFFLSVKILPVDSE